MASFTFPLGREYMGQGRLSHTICLRLVLIACAIQAATPDAHDIASVRSLRFFFPFLAVAGSLADDDELPDEVCGPAQFAANLISRTTKSGDLPCPPSGSNEFILPESQSNGLTSSSRQCCSARINDMIYCLCRINC
jgi:hypothetical protein